MYTCGAIIDNQGLLFVGHSTAGKSTIAEMMKIEAIIISDDRVIVRRWKEELKIHGIRSHGDVTDVSPKSTGLTHILFLNKALENRITRIEDKKEIFKILLSCLIKPFVTASWWESMLSLIEQTAQEVPCYEMSFDKSGKIIKQIKSKLFNQ